MDRALVRRSGSDMLFTKQALGLGLAWHCVLPLPAAEFKKDFSAEEWKQVESFLPEAEQVRVIAENGEREDAYLDAGMETVHACDVLLAVWNRRARPRQGRHRRRDCLRPGAAQTAGDHRCQHRHGPAAAV